MEFTKEQVQKAMQCKTVEELLELAKAEGIELSQEEAEEFIARMKALELTEEELKEVAGGEINRCEEYCIPLKYTCKMNKCSVLCMGYYGPKDCPGYDLCPEFVAPW